MGCMGSRVCGFDSHQLNCVLLLSYFFLFSSFLVHLIIFLYFIFPYSHIRMFSKNVAHMNNIHSVRKMFHRTEGVWSDSGIFERDKRCSSGIWCEVMGCMGCRVTGLIHINSTVFFRFLFFFSFLRFIFFIFPRSSDHISIFLYFYISYSHIHIFAYSHIRMFSKMQRTWTVCIPSGKCFIEQKGVWSDPSIFELDKCW
jgi:hypothetical protein